MISRCHLDALCRAKPSGGLRQCYQSKRREVDEASLEELEHTPAPLGTFRPQARFSLRSICCLIALRVNRRPVGSCHHFDSRIRLDSL